MKSKDISLKQNGQTKMQHNDAYENYDSDGIVP